MMIKTFAFCFKKVCLWSRYEKNSLPILMLTSKNDNYSKVHGLRAGADDYLTKPFEMKELIARVLSLIRRYTRFNANDEEVRRLTFNSLTIDLDRYTVTTQKGSLLLPPKEFDVLLYCARHLGKILTIKQIFAFIAVLPIIAFMGQRSGNFMAGVGFAFFYGFIGMIASGHGLRDLYPVTAGLSLIQYGKTTDVSENPLVDMIVLFVILVLSIVIVLNAKDRERGVFI